jgi:ribulose-phosphate 3-epimerase
VDPFIQAGSDLISIHLEPEYDHNATLDKIKKAGVQTGMVINPDTPVEGIIPFLDQLDLVLLMTVFPGFGGQKFIESVLEKAQVIADLRKENQNNFLIEVDGGVGPEHVTPCLESGVDIIVAGTAYYKRDQAGRKEFAEAIELN